MSSPVSRNIMLQPAMEAFAPAGITDPSGTAKASDRPKIMEKLNMIAMAFSMAAQQRDKTLTAPAGGPDAAYAALKEYVAGAKE